MDKQYYDIIGDIHGHANDLTNLLHHLGYEDSAGYFQHSTRKIIFLGDFIDRGVNQKRVLDIVMPMVEAKTAKAVMGNHEFNALAFHTPDPSNPSAWLRKRDDKNINQHIAFLNDYSSPNNKDDLNRVLTFFKSLPLWLEIDGIRVIHACWHDGIIDSIRSSLGENSTLTEAFFIAANREETDEYKAIEILLKGAEVRLPKGFSFPDKEGNERNEVRIQWWLNKADRLGDVAFGRYDEKINDLPVDPSCLVGYPEKAHPVFIGHYWLKGAPKPLANNIACLDYSVAKNGRLVAYRWSGEQSLLEENFTYA